MHRASHTHSSWQGKVLSTASMPTQGTFRPCHVSGGRSPPTHRPPPAARAEPEWQALSPARANVRLSLSCDSQAQPGNSGCHPHHAGHGARPPGQGPSRSEAPHLRRPRRRSSARPAPRGVALLPASNLLAVCCDLTTWKPSLALARSVPPGRPHSTLSSEANGGARVIPLLELPPSEAGTRKTHLERTRQRV